MSLLDEARTVRQRIAARLRELEPLVREYEELQQLAAEMGLNESDFASDAATPAPSPAGPGSGRGSPRRGTSGRRRAERRDPVAEPSAPRAGEVELADRVLEAVRAEPGKTVAEYGEVLGVAPTALYRPVRRLTNEGVVVKRARQLFPS